MSNIIYLYLKTHNKTGLKYLGKTIRDPFKYKGSGLHWTRHLNIHGYDVNTEILYETTDKEMFKKVAQEYSKMWNVVKSSDFANMIPEAGDGIVSSEDHPSFGKTVSEKTRKIMSENRKGRVVSDETRKNMSLAQKGKIVSDETRKKMSKAMSGKKRNPHSEETLKKMSEVKKGDKNPFYGRKHSEETLKKMSEGVKKAKNKS